MRSLVALLGEVDDCADELVMFEEEGARIQFSLELERASAFLDGAQDAKPSLRRRSLRVAAANPVTLCAPERLPVPVN